VNFSKEQLQTQLDLNQLGPIQGEANIPNPGFFLSGFEHPYMPIVRAQGSQFRWESATWGLVPSWAASAEKARELAVMGLNARSETAHEKPLFRQSWQHQPCLVPMKGFFEWKQEGTRKLPHFIQAQEGLLLAAGLCSSWVDPESGEEMQTYSILTTEANALMAEIHNVKRRMPVLLEGPQRAAEWMQGSAEERRRLCLPCRNDYLKAHRVAPFVSKPGSGRNRVECQAPFSEASQASLF